MSKKVQNEIPIMHFHPKFHFDPFIEAVKGIERIIFDSGLPYRMEYSTDGDYFTLKLENKTKEK